MRRIRSNRGNLFPTGQPKQAGHKDKYYTFICKKCEKVIFKKDSNIMIPGMGEFHLDCGMEAFSLWLRTPEKSND